MQEEIYTIEDITISHEDDTFVLRYASEKITFKLCELYAFRKKILEFDILAMLEPNAPDIEIFHIPHCDRYLLLTVAQVIQFRELLNGTFDILALNSSIHRILRKASLI
jgi:hypothetical protein